MELALASIKMLYIEKDSIHWEMFKNDCIEKEKLQIMIAFEVGYIQNHIQDAEEYYNQTYNQNKQQMTIKEKAKELFDKFNKPDTTHYPYVNNAQQCALIAVDEILQQILWDKAAVKYWNEVKQEIEKL